jgi:hypothetical protein
MDIEQPHLARLLQMDVEADGMPIGNGEAAVQLTLRVTIDLQRVAPTKSAPLRTAASSRSSTQGQRMTLLCGNATIGTPARSL